MCDLSDYIKISSSPSGCDSYHAEKFKCDRYLDCDSCLEDKIIEHDKHIIEQYKANTDLKNTIREIHDNVSKEMYCMAIDDCLNILKIHKHNWGVIEWAIRDIEKLKEQNK